MLDQLRKPTSDDLSLDRMLNVVQHGIRRAASSPGFAGTTIGAVTHVGVVPASVAVVAVAAVYEEISTDPDADTNAARRIAHLCALLPNGDDLRDAIEDDPDGVNKILTGYGEERADEYEAAVDRILSGDFSDVREDHEDDIDYLQRKFGTESREEAVAIFLDIQEVLHHRETHNQVMKIYDSLSDVEDNVESLQDNFEDGFDALETQIDSLSQTLQTAIEGQLGEAGFSILTEAYFAPRNPRSTKRCLQTGFSLIDLKMGYGFDRMTECDGDQVSVIDDLLSRVRQANRPPHIVIGPPGSGKTTLCRWMAAAWYNEAVGPVLYHKGDREPQFDSTRTLINAIETRRNQGEVLVVVEDVVRQSTAPIFSVIDNYMDDEDVAFLLEARTHEWDLDTFRQYVTDPSRRAVRKAIRSYTIPSLNREDCDRLISYVKTQAEIEVNISGEDLHQRLAVGYPTAKERNGTNDDNQFEFVLPDSGRKSPRVGDMLVVTYLLPIHDTAPNSGIGATGLEEHVDTTLNKIHPNRTSDRQLSDQYDLDVVCDVALLLNILNVAKLEPRIEYCYALADTDTSRDISRETIDGALNSLSGILVFGEPPTYRMYHSRWSALFLEELKREPLGDTSARTRVGRCVNALVKSVSDNTYRTQFEKIRASKPGPTTAEQPALFELGPDKARTRVLLSVCRIGMFHPPVVDLLGTSERPTINLSSLDTVTHIRALFLRARAYNLHDKMSEARTEYTTIRNLVADTLDKKAAAKVESICLRVLGHLASDFESAMTYYKNSERIARHNHHKQERLRAEIGRATLHAEYGNLEKAQNRFLNLIPLVGYEGMDAAMAHVSMNYATASIKSADLDELVQGDLEDEKESYERARNYAIKTGNNYLLVSALKNLGILSTITGPSEKATEFFEQGLSLARRFGFRTHEATLAGRLGNLYRYDTPQNAIEYLETAVGLYLAIDLPEDAIEYMPDLVLTLEIENELHRAGEYHKMTAEVIDSVTEGEEGQPTNQPTGKVLNMDILQILLIKNKTTSISKLYKTALSGIFRFSLISYETESDSHLLELIDGYAPSARLLQVCWERRKNTTLSSSERASCFASGVILHALGNVLAPVNYFAPDMDALSSIEQDYRANLRDSPATVYQYLTDDSMEIPLSDLDKAFFGESHSDDKTIFEKFENETLRQQESTICRSLFLTASVYNRPLRVYQSN